METTGKRRCSEKGLSSRHGINKGITTSQSQNNAHIKMQNNHQRKARWMAGHPSLMRADGRKGKVI